MESGKRGGERGRGEVRDGGGRGRWQGGVARIGGEVEEGGKV